MLLFFLKIAEKIAEGFYDQGICIYTRNNFQINSWINIHRHSRKNFRMHSCLNSWRNSWNNSQIYVDTFGGTGEFLEWFPGKLLKEILRKLTNDPLQEFSTDFLKELQEELPIEIPDFLLLERHPEGIHKGIAHKSPEQFSNFNINFRRNSWWGFFWKIPEIQKK